MGALWGFGAISLLLLALYGAHAFDFGGHGARALAFCLVWAGFFLIVGFYEEFFTRGYTQFTSSNFRGLLAGRDPAVSRFWHASFGESRRNWAGILGADLIGFFFCLTLRRNGNLWFAVGFRGMGWGKSYFYSVPPEECSRTSLESTFHGSKWLTGGSAGPEGSLLVFVLIALLWVAFDRVYREVKYPESNP